MSDAALETYEFLSSGPKGTIEKVVQYISIAKDVYDLALGDWDEEAQMKVTMSRAIIHYRKNKTL